MGKTEGNETKKVVGLATVPEALEMGRKEFPECEAARKLSASLQEQTRQRGAAVEAAINLALIDQFGMVPSKQTIRDQCKLVGYQRKGDVFLINGKVQFQIVDSRTSSAWTIAFVGDDNYPLFDMPRIEEVGNV